MNHKEIQHEWWVGYWHITCWLKVSDEGDIVTYTRGTNINWESNGF